MSVSTISKVNEKNTTNDIRINNLTVDGNITNLKITQLDSDITNINSYLIGQVSKFSPTYNALNGSITAQYDCINTVIGKGLVKQVQISANVEGIAPNTSSKYWSITLQVSEPYDSATYADPYTCVVNGAIIDINGDFIPLLSTSSYFNSDNEFLLFLQKPDSSAFTGETAFFSYTITYQRKA